MKHLNPRQGITTRLRLCVRLRLLHFRCETPKSPPGDYNHIGIRPLPVWMIKCETPKSPPGDYNRIFRQMHRSTATRRCETPKSPPGDYNCLTPHLGARVTNIGVKHLNPRQGITTGDTVDWSRAYTVVCETPKSPPGDYNDVERKRFAREQRLSVKHLNPRQGITTRTIWLADTYKTRIDV